MSYEEAVINNVLCWRESMMDEIWTEKTPEQLTHMLLEARRNIPQYVCHYTEYIPKYTYQPPPTVQLYS